MAPALVSSLLPGRAALFGGRAPRAPQQVGRVVAVRAEKTDRPVWFPGNPRPPHLDGSLPGDFGFDPLSLGSDPENLRWFQQAELVHGRWAMAAAAGILLPAIATKAGAVKIPQWYEAGKVWIDTHPAFPFSSMLFTQILLMGWVEGKRWADYYNPGSQGDGSFLAVTEELKGMENGYPGGKWFDPFGLSRGSPEQLAEFKEKEVKNGRLAMFAMLGFFAQFAATGKGPIDNLADHIASPTTTTFATNGVSLPFLQ